MEKKIIFVVGTPRSGTHLTAETIHSNIKKSYLLSEINEFWRSISKNKKTDIILAQDYSIDEINEIRTKFLSFYPKDVDVLIEKTASNILRLSLLEALFPNALFVFTCRNHSEVIHSIIKKVNGDPRKITKGNNEINLSSRLKVLRSIANDKLNSSTFDVKYYIKNVPKILSTIFSIVTGVKYNHWGPKFTDNKELLSLGQESYIIKQVDFCNKSLDRFVSITNVNYLFVDYNKLVDEPSNYEFLLAEFLCVDKIKYELNR